MSFLSGLVNISGKVAAVLTHPILSATKGTTAVVEKIKSQSSLVAYGTPLVQYGTAAAAVVSGGSALGIKSVTTTAGSKIISAVSSLIPTSTKGKIITAAVVPVIASAAYQNPTQAVQLPGKILNFQSNLGGLIANPSISKVIETAKENPVLTTLAGGAIVATIAGGVGLAANTLATYRNSSALRQGKEDVIVKVDQTKDNVTPQTIQIINQVPPVEASAMAAPGGKPPKKKAKKKKKDKKKTRRSKKKYSKKKKKSIKRSKS